MRLSSTPAYLKRNASSAARAPVATTVYGPFETMQLDGACGDVERGPRVSAVGAAIVAEVPDVGRRVVVRGPAANAVFRVCGVLERRPGEPRIVEAEDDGALVCLGERRELRIVAVDEQHGLGGQTAHGLAPALGDQL